MKPYTRGNFRVIKRREFNGYQVQVYIEKGDSWLDLGCSFDHLGNARLKVRNLHAACYTHLEVCESKDLNFPGRRYIKTGKLAKSKFVKYV